MDTGARKNETHVRLKCLCMRHHDKLFKAMHFFHPWFNNINVSSMLKKIKYIYIYIYILWLKRIHFLSYIFKLVEVQL